MEHCSNSQASEMQFESGSEWTASLKRRVNEEAPVNGENGEFERFSGANALYHGG
jgi:hypothetical protein